MGTLLHPSSSWSLESHNIDALGTSHAQLNRTSINMHLNGAGKKIPVDHNLYSQEWHDQEGKGQGSKIGTLSGTTLVKSIS